MLIEIMQLSTPDCEPRAQVQPVPGATWVSNGSPDGGYWTVSVCDLEELRQLVRQTGEPCTIEFLRTKRWGCQDPSVSARIIIINSIADDLVPYLDQC
jgi:hypothetical protein